MKILKPNKVIQALENSVIIPYKNYNPILGVIIKKNAKPDELSYLKSLVQKADEYDAIVQIEEVSTLIEAFTAINEFKRNCNIFGIINLSTFGLNGQSALNARIPPRLDIDCVNYTTLGMLMGNPSPIAYRLGPCAAVAATKILQYEKIDLTNKKVAILGRSLRVGRPLAEILSQKDATVTVFHSKSQKFMNHLDDFDIVISAIGQPEKISYQDYFSNTKPENLKTILIDIGVNINSKGKICGDFDFDSFKETNVSITPVPGCIGTLATTVLFAKLFANAHTFIQ